MFEGQINRASFGETRESEVLRRFRWTDLVARLAATRDLQDEIARQGDGDFSSFTSLHRETEEGKPTVNHDASSYGKVSPLNVDLTAQDAVQGDRETK